MRDLAIRQALLTHLAHVHRDDRCTVIVEELGLCQGDARIDVAVVNGSLTGYEIKSAYDTLDRLPGQNEMYSRSLTHVTVVAAGEHLIKLPTLIPSWWGITRAMQDGERVALTELRSSRQNPAIDPVAVAQLLWREELLQELDALGICRGVRSKPRRALWSILAETVSLDTLIALVRRRLKARGDWRAAR